MTELKNQMEDLTREILKLRARVLDLETDNRKVFRKLSTLKVEDKQTFIVIAKYGTYSLIYNVGAYEPWIVANGYNEENKCWGHGHYFEIFADAIKYLFDNEPVLESFRFHKESEDDNDE